MNSHIALNAQGLAYPLPAAGRRTSAAALSALEISKAVPSKLTLSGGVLFVTCLLMFGSGFKAFRPEIAGLLVHPFLLPIAIVSPFLLVGRLRSFPSKILMALTIFCGLYALATVGGGLKGAASEIIKVATTVVTMVAVALLIRSRGDFIAGVVGLSAAAGLMGMYGINAMSDPAQGGSALDVGNKNAFSLFVLPPMLVGGYLILDMPVKRKVLRIMLKVLMVVTVSTCALAIFLSGNRSGYLGCVVIAGMLLKEKKLYGLLLVGMVAAALVYIMMSFQMTGVFEQRWKQTFVERNVSDELRGHIILACIQIGFEYPLAGVSASRLPLVIGSKISSIHTGFDMIESHNVFAHIWASSGMFCFASLGYVAWTLWTLQGPQNKQDLPLQREGRQALRLLKMMVLLWILRGAFTSAILYNPGFSMAMGLAIGYCILLSAEPTRRAGRGALPAAPPGMALQY